jgi:hypothetical protein
MARMPMASEFLTPHERPRSSGRRGASIFKFSVSAAIRRRDRAAARRLVAARRRMLGRKQPTI